MTTGETIVNVNVGTQPAAVAPRDICGLGGCGEQRRCFAPISAPERNVYVIEGSCNCAACGRRLEATDAVGFFPDGPNCLWCCGLGSLEFVPAGDPSLTKLAEKFSDTKASVFRRPVEAPRRKHKRVGTLVPPESAARAREQAAHNARVRAWSLHLPRLRRRRR